MNDKTFQLGARVESLPTWALREFIQNAGSKFNARDKQLLVKEAVRLLSQGVERKATTAKATTALERRFPLHPQGEKRKTMARRRLQRLTDKIALNAMENAERAARNFIYYRCNGRLKAKKADAGLGCLRDRGSSGRSWRVAVLVDPSQEPTLGPRAKLLFLSVNRSAKLTP